MKVVLMVQVQSDILREYKMAWERFRRSAVFSIDELDYVRRVYDQLPGESKSHTGDLARILTSGTLRMNDAERLKAIDAQ